MSHNCKVIATVNQKGGVAKTTTTAALGSGLAHAGYKTLLIDFDPQGNLTTGLGYTDAFRMSTTITELMGMVINNAPFTIEDFILPHSSGISLIPSNIKLASLEITLVNTMSRENVLRTCIKDLRSEFDYILIDSGPSLGMLTVNALTAADSVLIPVQPHKYAVDGIQMVFDSIKQVRRHLNPQLSLEGILVTLLDDRSTFVREMVSGLRSAYGNSIRIFDSMIPMTVRAAEAAGAGKSILDYDPESTAAAAYANLTKEIIDNNSKEKTKDNKAYRDIAR